MAKYNPSATAQRAVRQTPYRAAQASTGKTHEGGEGFARDEKLELFLRAISSFAGEDSYYEDKTVRDDRARDLVRKIASDEGGWSWLTGFLPWLRTEGFMRSMPVLLTAEAVHARLQAKLAGGSRQLIAAILSRADEPGEFIAYWISRFGRNLPKPVKRGVADAALRLYSERSLLKYDTASHALRFGDVLELVHVTGTHPSVKGTWKGDLYEHAIDRRHNRPNPVPESLKLVAANKAMNKAVSQGEVAVDEADADDLAEAGMTWEQTLSLAGKDADKARVWEAQVKSGKTGYMALLRNLRNLDKAGVSAAVKGSVAARLSDPAQVAKSMQFPFRFYSAYKELSSLTWGPALETALGYSTANIPELPGRTLILIDTSGSMNAALSAKSKMTNAEAAALFGFATAARNIGRVDVWAFASFSADVTGYLTRGGSVLKAADKLRQETGRLGYGTETDATLRRAWNGQDRVLIFTDGQSFPANGYGGVGAFIPATTPMYSWNLNAYTFTGMSGKGARYELGGLNDSTFRLIPLLEAGAAAKWPWEE